MSKYTVKPASAELDDAGLPAHAFSDAPKLPKKAALALLRGTTVWNIHNRQQSVVSIPGPLAADLTDAAPATEFDEWDGKAWVTNSAAQQAAAVASAQAEQAERIQAAQQATQLWQTELALTIISDADREMLTRYMAYIRQVQAINCTAAPDISWPEPPEAQMPPITPVPPVVPKPTKRPKNKP